ncbi:hypothetical protein ACQP1V_27375 [Microtetraspora malaysiensis]|uniref:hypothetical protein n=1 Tax=Microtetraspora malaysiensis TaxID=161358 RepID=UPI003D932453
MRKIHLATVAVGLAVAASTLLPTAASAAPAASCVVPWNSGGCTTNTVTAYNGFISTQILVDGLGNNTTGQLYDAVSGVKVGPQYTCTNAGQTCGNVTRGLSSRYYFKIWCSGLCSSRASVYN